MSSPFSDLRPSASFECDEMLSARIALEVVRQCGGSACVTVTRRIDGKEFTTEVKIDPSKNGDVV